MKYKVRDVRLDGRKVLAICDGPLYTTYAKKRAERLEELAIQIFLAQETEEGIRYSEYTLPVYIQSFRVRKFGRRYRLVNVDPGMWLVEFGAHPGGGTTQTLKYAPMRKALDAVESEERG